MLKNKPRKPANRRAFGPPRGRQYRRDQPYGRYLVCTACQPDSTRFFASRPKAKAYARRLANALGKQISIFDFDMGQSARCKYFNPRSKPKC